MSGARAKVLLQDKGKVYICINAQTYTHAHIHTPHMYTHPHTTHVTVIAERSEANKRVQCQPTYVYIYKWVRSLHPLGSLRSLQLLRAWLSLASLAQSHGCDEVGKERD